MQCGKFISNMKAKKTQFAKSMLTGIGRVHAISNIPVIIRSTNRPFLYLFWFRPAENRPPATMPAAIKGRSLINAMQTFSVIWPLAI